VERAKQAVALAPESRFSWTTLGVAQYRAGAWKESIAALNKAMELPKGEKGFDRVVVAMAHWQLGHKDQAREWYDRAVEWIEKNAPQDELLRRFRAEAAELLGLKEK